MRLETKEHFNEHSNTTNGEYCLAKKLTVNREDTLPQLLQFHWWWS